MRRIIQLSLFISMLFIFNIVMAANKQSMGYLLACIDSKEILSKSNPSVIKFNSLLKQLDETYVENRQRIGDITVVIQKRLKNKYGIKESLCNILEGMNQILYIKIKNQKYAEYIIVYLQLRKSGMSHKDAIVSFQAMIADLLKGAK